MNELITLMKHFVNEFIQTDKYKTLRCRSYGEYGEPYKTIQYVRISVKRGNIVFFHKANGLLFLVDWKNPTQVSSVIFILDNQTFRHDLTDEEEINKNLEKLVNKWWESDSNKQDKFEEKLSLLVMNLV